MPSRAPRASRLAVIAPITALVAGVLVGTVLVDPPATASTTSTSVTILLKAPNASGLDALADATGLSHAQRVEDLAALVPSAADRASVGDALRAEGFTIDDETAWTIDATAAQPTVTNMFGVNRARTADNQVVPTGALPDIPTSLSGLVAAVLPSANAPAAFAPMVCHGCNSGTDFRNAYTGVGNSPATGQGSAGAESVTIASLQFAGWDDSDLTKYAAATAAPLGDPVASGQYVSVPTGKTAVPTKSTAGSDEVDLDQESLLSTDPYAKQRAYFNVDTTQGYVDELSQVFDDVTQHDGPTTGDPHIVALTTSWGSCESEFAENFPGDTISSIETLLKAISGAGVTIFAASGDDGVYDCGDSKTSTKVAVDYPASSPEVVAVGGTHLTAPGGRVANAGTNWAERGWTCATTEACEGATGSGGSGGGESSVFPLPAYQRQGIGSQPFTTSTKKTGNFGTQPHRMVPDISADGDPETGFSVLTSDPVDVCHVVGSPCMPSPGETVTVQIGGTSLASPVSAALFTDQLSAAGRTTGIGGIHAALYSAYHDKSAGAFRDVTSGSNGKQSDVDSHAKSRTAAELPVTAQKGFDTVSGLGSPLWSRLDGYLFSPKSPRGVASLTLAKPDTVKHKDQVKVHWNYKPARTDGMLAGSSKVVVTKVGSHRPVYSKAKAAASGTAEFTGKPGGEYLLTVTPTSLTGAAGTPASAVVLIPFDNSHFTYQGAWVKRANSTSFGGAIESTAASGSSAKAAATGRTYSIAVRTGPSYGILTVFHGSTRVDTIDLYSNKPGHKIVTFWQSPEAHLVKRSFTFHDSGHRNTASSGTTVDVDALYVARE